MFKIGFIKLGNVASSLVADLALDEIAERTDIETKTLGFGAKMTTKEAERSAELNEWDPQMVVIVGANAATPGPIAARELYKDVVSTVVVSDGPVKKDAREALEAEGFGYIILPFDPLIGAKREFLDPAEMALFNANVLKVLSICGAVRLVQEELDCAMASITAGDLNLPHILASPEICTERMDFQNPYARAKAMAALHLAQITAGINAQACFRLKELERIALAAATGHEVMRAAAMLADEAREIEKASDTVSRKPHARSGALLKKTGLLDKTAQV